MHFEDFLKYTPKIQNVELPATHAHAKMAPSNRLDLIKAIDFSKVTPKQAAVLMLFYPKASQTHLALILRTSYNGVHSSQIAFPGGKVEDFDVDLRETALRETHEEIGVNPNHVNVIRAFTEVYIPPSNFMVSAFMGISQQTQNFVLQPDEVSGIIELPVTDLLNDSLVQNVRMNTSYGSDISVPAFVINDHIVWGATAMILSEIKETFRAVF